MDYAIVKSRRWRFYGRMMLPFTIGSDPTSTIIVNSDAAHPAMRIVTAHEGRLVFFDPEQERITDDSFANAYGFLVKGPFPANLLGVGAVTRRYGEFLGWEKTFFSRAPKNLQLFLGGFMSQRLRLISWSLISLIALVSVAVLFGQPKNVEMDSSKAAIHAMYGSVLAKKIGSVPSFRDLKRGATLQYTIPKDSQGKSHILSFDLKDNDINGEIVVKIADKIVFVSEADKQCLANSCPHDVMIPAELTAGETLTIFFQHMMPQSDYVITNLILEQARPLKPEEQRTVERWFAAAQRNYNERFVAYENLIRAIGELDKIKKVLRTKEGVEDLRAKTESLRQEIEDVIEAKIKDLWFIAQQQRQLGKYEEARTALLGIKVLLRNPSDPRLLQTSKAIREAEEFLK